MGTTLKRHDGDITVTTAGTVLDGLDIHGFVTIKAANVTIKNSIIRGGKATNNRGIVTNYGYKNLVVQRIPRTSFLKFETVYQDGMKGSDFTLRRVHITGNVDSVKVQGSNVSAGELAAGQHQSTTPATLARVVVLTHTDDIEIQQDIEQPDHRQHDPGCYSNFAILGSALHRGQLRSSS